MEKCFFAKPTWVHFSLLETFGQRIYAKPIACECAHFRRLRRSGTRNLRDNQPIKAAKIARSFPCRWLSSVPAFYTSEGVIDDHAQEMAGSACCRALNLSSRSAGARRTPHVVSGHSQRQDCICLCRRHLGRVELRRRGAADHTVSRTRALPQIFSRRQLDRLHRAV